LPYQQQVTREELHFQLDKDLQQEAALLTAAVNSDPGSVQKMEQRMVEISTSIGQFTNPVSEQQ
jgi:archaellum component FlaC